LAALKAPSKVAHLADSKVVKKDTKRAELLVGMMVAQLDGILAEMRVVVMDLKKDAWKGNYWVAEKVE
jgi:hypothetical protein